MSQLIVLSKFFIKDLIYKKIFLVSLVLGLFFIVLSLLLGPLSYSEESRLATNFSLAGSQVALILLSILVGSNFIREDVDSKSIFAFLTSPITRRKYVLSKFLAFSLGLMIMVLAMWVSFFIVSVVVGIEMTSVLHSFLPFWGIYLESVLLFSFSIMVSMHASFLLSVALSFSVFLAGHWLDTIHFLMGKAEGVGIKIVSLVFLYGLPNLESLNWKAQLTYNDWEPSMFYLKNTIYAFFWIALLLFISVFSFSKKDL